MIGDEGNFFDPKRIGRRSSSWVLRIQKEETSGDDDDDDDDDDDGRFLFRGIALVLLV